MLGDWISYFRATENQPEPAAKSLATSERLLALYDEQPAEMRIIGTLAVGSLVTLASFKVYNRYLRRFPSHGWITPDLYAQQRWIKGKVTSVGDADGFKLYHMPGPLLLWKFRRIPDNAKELVNQTVTIRLAGIDAPELGHFGKEPQPFSKEALAWLKDMILGKIIYCQLLSHDQYRRSVAAPVIPRKYLPKCLTPLIGRDVADEMLQAGLAVTYTAKGAVYGPSGKENHLALEAKAKERRQGQWVNGTNIETPAEYKKRHRSGSTSDISEVESEEMADVEEIQKPKRRRKIGRLRRWFSKMMSSR